MADVTTYLADIAARAEVLSIGTHTVIDEAAGVSLCEVPVVEVSESGTGTAALRKTMKFYVDDYGGAGETCYDFKTEPKPQLTPEEKFADVVLNWIYSNSYANVAEIITLDNDRKKARLLLYIQVDATNYEVKEAIAWKDNGTPPEIRYLP